MKQAFTLIELLMVIAIIAIISTLAVSKVGGIRETAARRVSFASQKAVERGVEAFLAAGGRLNRLDALLEADGSNVQTGGSDGFGDTIQTNALSSGGFYHGPTQDLGGKPLAEIAESNAGLTAGLRGLFCYYSLSAAEVSALTERLGLRILEFHNIYANPLRDAAMTPFRRYGYGQDGTVPQALDGMDPDLSACVARMVTNGMYVAAINPKTDAGRIVYQAFGQEVMNTKEWGQSYTDADAIADAKSTGGVLVAFGLGDSASIIGKANAGLESVPYATYVQKRFYRRYVLVFRLKTLGSASVSTVIPEFAGVLDCCGNTLRAAQYLIKSL